MDTKELYMETCEIVAALDYLAEQKETDNPGEAYLLGLLAKRLSNISDELAS